jgi:hypothetical protein
MLESLKYIGAIWNVPLSGVGFMNSKRNQIALGVILFLVGISLVTRNFSADMSPVALLMAGAALLLLFIMKRKNWALFTGAYVSWFASMELFDGFARFVNASVSLWYPTFFIVTALVFFSLFLLKRRTKLIIPSSILFWIGVYGVADEINFFSDSLLSPLVCAGLSFITAFLLGRGFVRRWALYAGVGVVSVGIAMSFGWNSLGIWGTGVAVAKIFASLFLIGLSVVIILNAFRNKK